MRSTVILVDCDGVIADFTGAVCRHLPGRTPQDFDEYDMRKALSPEEQKTFELLGSMPGFCAGIDWYPQGRLFVRVLRALGSVYCVTAPWSAKTWEHERRAWLSDVLDASRVISCPADAKHLLRGDVLIEDHPRNAARWLASNPAGVALLLDRPWNQEGSLTWSAAKVAGPADRIVRCPDYVSTVRAVRRVQEAA